MKHTYVKEDRGTTYCGSHYCDGHKNIYLVCSCGWEIKSSLYDWKDQEKLENAKINHVLRYEGLIE